MAGSVREIEANGARHQWVSVAGNINATGWTGQLTFGARTVTVGAAVQVPAWAKSIDGAVLCSIADGAAAVGTVSARKFVTGLGNTPQYILDNCISQQTTTGDSYSGDVMTLAPNLKVSGPIQVQATPGVNDAGSGTAITSLRFSDAAARGNGFYWLAASAGTTAATDTLSDALTALGGDTIFPFTVPPATAGVRALQFGLASDMAATGSSIGQFRFEGQGFKDNPHDLSGNSVGGEGAASSEDSRLATIIDDWLGVNAGSQIDLLAGYTGVDTGGETLAMGLAFQM